MRTRRFGLLDQGGCCKREIIQDYVYRSGPWQSSTETVALYCNFRIQAARHVSVVGGRSWADRVEHISFCD